MIVYLHPHTTYSYITEKEVTELQELIDYCNSRIIGKIGFTIYGSKTVDYEGRNVYGNILYSQKGKADNKE